MNGYYEKNRDDEKKLVLVQGKDGNYPPHFHLSIEVTLLKKGEQEFFVNGERFLLTDGSISVADSYDVHSYHTEKQPIDCCVVLFPYSFFQRFDERRQGKAFVNKVFYDKELCEKLLDIVETYIKPAVQTENIELQRIASDLFLCLIAEKAEFEEKKGRGETELVRAILQFLHNNFRGDASRERLSKELGYTKEHISRVFHRYTRKNLNEYVNDLRLEYIKTKRNEGDKRTELALLYEAGFNSYQTYYRVKSKNKKR